MVVLTKNLGANLKQIFPTKEERLVEIKRLLTLANTAGVDIDAVVIDKGASEFFYNLSKVAASTVWGFSKCYLIPDNIADPYIESKIVAKFNPMKYVFRFVSLKEIVTCYLEESDKAWTSEAGLKVMKTELEVMGANEILNAFE